MSTPITVQRALHVMQPQERPPASSLSLKDLLTLPHRLCNPPPSVGKVRSCSVTPLLDVRLDDVLERKHLPPLGLKDFEEYLLYVEQCPENLYFVLWLKEYTTRYHTWAQRTKATLTPAIADPVSHTHRQPFLSPPSSDPSLALFYAKAKQTFFTPGAEYELDVPSDILAPFHYSSTSSSAPRARAPAWNSQKSHPDPAVFTEVVLEVRSMLDESLSRFVRAASTNSGSRRVFCGIVGGLLLLSIAVIIPLVLTSGHWHHVPRTRWWRIIAFPGIWLGFVAVLTNINGICILVYIFGDLRQLRKFELERPVISRPLPAPLVTTLAEPTPRPPELRHDLAISTHHDKQYDPAHFSSTSLRSASECSDAGPSEFGASEIEVSPAYFDDTPAPEGPATAAALYRSHYRTSQSSIALHSTIHPEERMGPPTSLEHHAPDVSAPNGPVVQTQHEEGFGHFPQGAAFIRHEVDLNTGNLIINRHVVSPGGQNDQERFDFNLLPRAIRVDHIRPAGDVTTPVATTSAGGIPAKTEDATPNNFVAPSFTRRQYKCKRIYQPPLAAQAAPFGSYAPSNSNHFHLQTVSFMIPSYTAGVPAFNAPMTRVHSPVVIRAQWEIVIRSAVLGVICAATLVAIFVGVVP